MKYHFQMLPLVLLMCMPNEYHLCKLSEATFRKYNIEYAIMPAVVGQQSEDKLMTSLRVGEEGIIRSMLKAFKIGQSFGRDIILVESDTIATGPIYLNRTYDVVQMHKHPANSHTCVGMNHHWITATYATGANYWSLKAMKIASQLLTTLNISKPADHWLNINCNRFFTCAKQCKTSFLQKTNVKSRKEAVTKFNNFGKIN